MGHKKNNAEHIKYYGPLIERVRNWQTFLITKFAFNNERIKYILLYINCSSWLIVFYFCGELQFSCLLVPSLTFNGKPPDLLGIFTRYGRRG